MQNNTLNDRGESRFVANTVALVTQTVFATLLTLLQIKLLSNFLSRETFGLFASLRGFSLLLAMISAGGIPQLLVRFIPVHESNRERREALRLAAAGVVAATALLALVAILVHVLHNWTFRFVPAGVLEGGLYFWFYAATLGVMLKLVLYGGLNGLRRLTVQVVIETLSLLAVLVWILAERNALTLPGLFRILGVVHLAAVGVGLPLFFLSLRNAVPPKAGTENAMGTGDVRATAGMEDVAPAWRHRYLSYLVWAAGLSLVALAFTDVDRYLLAQVISLELLALFHIGARISRLANRLLGVANLAFQPEITRLGAEGREERVVHSTRIFLKFNSAVAVLIAVLLVVFAREIIILVSSDGYIDAVPLLIILAVSFPLTTMTAPITSVMKALDQVREALLCDLIWAVSYVVLILVLAPPFGLVGVGAAHLCACMAQLLLALSLSRLPIDVRYVGGLGARLVAAGLASFSPVLIIDAAFGPDTIWFSGLKALLFVLGTLVFRRMLRGLNILNADERAALAALLEARRVGVIGRLIGI